MSENYDTIEVAIPIHSREEEQKLDDIRAKLSDELTEKGRERRLVTMEKQGQLPNKTVTIRCYLTDSGASWKKVRMCLAQEGILELKG